MKLRMLLALLSLISGPLSAATITLSSEGTASIAVTHWGYSDNANSVVKVYTQTPGVTVSSTSCVAASFTSAQTVSGFYTMYGQNGFCKIEVRGNAELFPVQVYVEQFQDPGKPANPIKITLSRDEDNQTYAMATYMTLAMQVNATNNPSAFTVDYRDSVKFQPEGKAQRILIIRPSKGGTPSLSVNFRATMNNDKIPQSALHFRDNRGGNCTFYNATETGKCDMDIDWAKVPAGTTTEGILSIDLTLN